MVRVTTRGRVFGRAVAGALILALLATTAQAASASVSTDDAPETSSDFVPLAIEGFEQTVNGAGGLVPNPDGNRLNDYIWSSAVFDGALFAGTVRGVLSGVVGGDLTSGLADLRAEIWRYDFAGNGGAEGTWTRVHRSPLIADELPRDFGYRSMAVCGGRLYVTTTGVAPRILVTADGESFSEASRRGLPSGDLGFRGLECFDGWLVTSPLGTTGDPDISTRPVMLANRFPTFGRWQEISLPGFGDPDNVGVFATALWDRDGDGSKDTIVAGTLNRTTGAEVWAVTDPCGYFSCTDAVGNWEKLIDYGAGRPFAPPWIRDDGAWGPSNAGVSWMTEFQGDLYIGLGESGFSPAGVTLSEIVVLHRDGTWELVAGAPRGGIPGYNVPADLSDLAGLAGTPSSQGYAVLPIGGSIASTALFTDGPAVTIPYPLAGNGCDPAVDPADAACHPISDKGLGMSDVVDPNAPPPGFGTGIYNGTIAGLYAALNSALDVPLSLPAPNPGGATWNDIHPLVRAYVGLFRVVDGASASYIWQLEVHEGLLYASSLDVLEGGFELWSTTGGPSPTFTTVFDDGLGTDANYGGRRLLSTGYGLVIGTANPFGDESVSRGGAEVWLGTCGVDSAPTVDAGDDLQLTGADTAVTDAGVDGTVAFGLDGSASDGFCGSLASTTWYEGTCAGPLSEVVSTELDPTGIEGTVAGADSSNAYDFSLVAVDGDGRTSCDDTTVRIGIDPPPTVTIPMSGGADTCGLLAATVAAVPGDTIPVVCEPDFEFPFAEYADSDLDDVVYTTIAADCEAPGSAPLDCQWATANPYASFVSTDGDKARVLVTDVAQEQPIVSIVISTVDPDTGFAASDRFGIDTDRVPEERGVVAEMTGTADGGIFGFRWTGEVGVLIEDFNGTPVAGVEVTVVQTDLFSPVEGEVCTTGADGRCEVAVGPLLASTASFTVSDLTLPGKPGFYLARVDDTLTLERP